MLEVRPADFFDAFRGMFSGAVYFKKLRKWLVFSDHIGNKPVFYYAREGQVILGSQLSDITNTMHHNHIPVQLDRNGANQFATFGCFMDESTWISGVRRILPCDCIELCSGTVQVRTYHHFAERSDEQMTEDEAIQRLDAAFCQAVQRGIDKNREYGYTGIIDISGGADSRMIAYTAKRLGASDTILAHYSQSDSNEMKIALHIANQLDLSCYANTLDDAEFMRDAEENTRMNSGVSYYFGLTGGKRVLRALSGSPVGIEFTGLLGDISEGAMLGVNGMDAPSLNYQRFHISSAVPLSEITVNTLDRFQTDNMFWLFTRGMLCGMGTFPIRQHYVEPYTPYGDVDFMDAIQSIPYEMKTKQKIQLKWMKQFYPQALQIMYATTGLPLSMDLAPLGPQFTRVYVKLLSIKSHFTGRAATNMNPIARWEQEKPWLPHWKKDFMERSLQKLRTCNCVEPNFLELLSQLFQGPMMSQYLAISMACSCVSFLCPPEQD